MDPRLPRPILDDGPPSPTEGLPAMVLKGSHFFAIPLSVPHKFWTHFISARSRGCYGGNCSRCRLTRRFRQSYAPVLHAKHGGFRSAAASPFEAWKHAILPVPFKLFDRLSNPKAVGKIFKFNWPKDGEMAAETEKEYLLPSFPVPEPFDLTHALTRYFFPDEWEASQRDVPPAAGDAPAGTFLTDDDDNPTLKFPTPMPKPTPANNDRPLRKGGAG